MKGVTRVISFTSGKGGVGKTNTVVNIGIALARQGNRVLLLDADLGLANIDILLGLQPKFTLEHVFKGIKKIDDIMLDGPEGISVIPAASGVDSICNLTAERRILLMDAIEQVATRFDYLLIDTSAGIASDVMYFNSASGEVVVVINPEPTSLTDSYAVIKLLSQDYGQRDFYVLTNEVADEAEGIRTFKKLARTVDRFLSVNLKYLGHVPSDKAVNEAIQSQRAVMEMYPSSPSGLSFAALAKKFDTEHHQPGIKGGVQLFFKQLLEMNIGN